MVKVEDLARAGFKYLGRSYKEMDCQKFVEKCLADIGIRMDLPGSNPWFRKMTWTGTPEECKKRFGCVPAGAFLFILAFDGGERARGYTDILGNASHIGIVTNTGKGAIHSSQSRGEVCESAFRGKTIPNGGWNRVGLWNALSYGAKIDALLNGGNAAGQTDSPRPTGEESIEQDGKEETMEQTATIRAVSGSTVNLRKHQDKGSALVDRMPIGATVTVEYLGDEWSRVRYKGKTGYVMTEFLKFDDDHSSASGSGFETENGFDIGDESGEKPDQVMISLSRAQAELLRPVLNALLNQL